MCETHKDGKTSEVYLLRGMVVHRGFDLFTDKADLLSLITTFLFIYMRRIHCGFLFKCMFFLLTLLSLVISPFASSDMIISFCIVVTDCERESPSGPRESIIV